MPYIRAKDIAKDAGIQASDLNACFTETFKAPAVGATAGATAASMTVLAYQDASSGSVSITQGAFTLQSPDVPRGLWIYLTGGATSFVTGSRFVARYYGPNGTGLKTKTITGLTLGGSTATARIALGAGVSRLYSFTAEVAGNTLTGVQVGVAYHGDLAVNNPVTNLSHIVHESGRSTPPSLNTTTGLFTPGTTLNSSNDVEIRVHYGTSR
jgi:hypothetical protein